MHSQQSSNPHKWHFIWKHPPLLLHMGTAPARLCVREQPLVRSSIIRARPSSRLHPVELGVAQTIVLGHLVLEAHVEAALLAFDVIAPTIQRSVAKFVEDLVDLAEPAAFSETPAEIWLG